jgi:hypothetical protein
VSEATELAELKAEVASLKAQMELVFLMLATPTDKPEPVKPEAVKIVTCITDVPNLQL